MLVHKHFLLLSVIAFYHVLSAPVQSADEENQEDQEDDEIEKGEKTVFREIFNANKDLNNSHVVNIDIYKRNHHIERRTAIVDTSKYWTGGVVTYKIDYSFDSSTLAIIAESICEIEMRTCLKFNKYEDLAVKPTSYISIVSEDGCWSEIGMQPTVQKLSLSDGCRLIATVQHEIMHALGFDHEQNRADRDTYVTINWANIEAAEITQFQKVSSQAYKLMGTYDYKSIMHYDVEAFSSNGQPTMTALQPLIGQMGVSQSIQQSDIDGINTLYNCAAAPIVNGVWSEWEAWESCSVSCADGTRTRGRKCNNPKPSNGGTVCSGSTTETEACNDGVCPVVSQQTCNFDTDFCDWTVQVGSGDTCQWIRKSGSTGIPHTGPSGDHTSGTGHYIYPQCTSIGGGRRIIGGHGRGRGGFYRRGGRHWNARGGGRGRRHVTQPHYSRSRATITSATLSSTGAGQKRCLSIWYHILGWRTGTIKVYQLPTTSVNFMPWPLFYMGHNRGNMWHHKQIELDASYESKVLIQYSKKRRSWGVVALDDITITDGPCVA